MLVTKLNPDEGTALSSVRFHESACRKEGGAAAELSKDIAR
jgi:hypothetical protein